MPKTLMKPFRPIYPSPAALITSVAPNGKANVITLGEVYNLSVASPVVVGISIAKQRYSHGLISQSGEFVVNLPTAAMAEQVDRCGCLSGRDVDKFRVVGFTALESLHVRPPLIGECPVNLECKLTGVRQVGDHDMFRGEVVAQHVEESLLDEQGRIDVGRLDVLCFVKGQYWSLGRKLGEYGFSGHAERDADEE